jgi:hypothetical protein
MCRFNGTWSTRCLYVNDRLHTVTGYNKQAAYNTSFPDPEDTRQPLFSTLNQNVELGVSNDGMGYGSLRDRTENQTYQVASAMRPVIVVLEGESLYIKGNRSSIGGESVAEKFFDDQEYYFREGDTLYLLPTACRISSAETKAKK